jgi:flagellin
LQTAEGALNENAAILNRLRELAIQSQADSLTTNDRLEIQKEVDQLIEEIDRTSSTTEFNTKKLLDGNASAKVSTSSSGLKVFQLGSGDVAAGDYVVTVSLEDGGTKQVQKSSIQTLDSTGNKAALTTKLGELTSMFNSFGKSLLENPQVLTLRGNGQKVDISISSDLTLQDFAGDVEDAIINTLGISGSTFAYDAQNGQFVYEAGRDGRAGEISMSADEDMLIGFGFQATTLSSEAAYKVTSRQLGSTSASSVNTTSSRASGAIAGLDLQFETPAQARIKGTVAASEVITVGGTDVKFSFSDTNASTTEASATTRIDVTLTANRSYTLGSIETIINDAISDASTSPGVTASFNGYDLVLTSSVTGTSGVVSVYANSAATDILGLRTGITTGSGGSYATLTGSVDTGSGVEIGSTELKFKIGDGDRNLTEDIIFVADSSVSATSLVDVVNTALTAADVSAVASINSDGQLEIVSTETGGDARVSIASSTGSLGDIGYITGQSSTGTGGTAATLTGTTHENVKNLGYTLDGALNMSISDKNGGSSGTITVSYDGTTTDSISFSISQSSLSTVLDASNINSTDVGYEFDAGARLNFYSRSAGQNSRILLSVGEDQASDDKTNGRNAFGIDFSQSAQGDGENTFRVHVSDRALNFQIGANQGQLMSFRIGNMGVDALGISGLDVTNITSATRALSDIDYAVNVVSSERSKLGSIQNRLTSTMNNLTTTATNLQATESLIRDVDIAKETVDFTRNQILMQAGTAQLAQSKNLGTTALQLLS